MNAEHGTTLALDHHVSGISSTVTWIPDLDPARRRALGEAVVALRLSRSDFDSGQTKLSSAGMLEETDEEEAR